MRPLSIAGHWLLWLVLLLPAPAAALPPSVFSDGGYLIGTDQGLILAHHQDRPLVPASTWKIATALMALERLGPDYRFPTAFYLVDGNLFIKGFGDPMLISEEVADIAAALAAAGVRTIGDLVVDDSHFKLERSHPAGSAASRRAYDAANGALVVNFNTIKIGVQGDGTVRSAEPQTPTLPVMRQWTGQLPAGEYRLNLSQQVEHSRQYSGELFQHLLARAGIKVNGALRGGITPAGAQPVYRHYSSRTLAAVVEAMLLYSNNFIANQLFLAAGAADAGPPATWSKGRHNLHHYLAGLGLASDSFRVEEGSGLSRGNRISPEALRRVLEQFRPHAELLPQWQGHLAKSGTLNGVYAYAGYFRHHHQLDPFVLILQQDRNTRDRALAVMAEYWRQHRQQLKSPADQP